MSTTPASTEPLEFGYWVPNVSGGLVISGIEQRTGWDYDYNKRLARTAEDNGFEQVAHRMLDFKRRGVDLFLLGFLHFQEEVEHFGRHVLPIVRELEAAEQERVA